MESHVFKALTKICTGFTWKKHGEMSTFSNNGFLQNKLAKRLWSHTGYAIASSLTFLWWPTPTTIMCYCRRHSPLLKQRLQLKDENTLTNCIDTTFLYHARPHWHKRTQRNTTSTSSIIIAASSHILCRSFSISDKLTYGLSGYAKRTPCTEGIKQSCSINEILSCSPFSLHLAFLSRQHMTIGSPGGQQTCLTVNALGGQ